MKRLLRFVLIIVLIIALLTGCDKSANIVSQEQEVNAYLGKKIIGCEIVIEPVFNDIGFFINGYAAFNNDERVSNDNKRCFCGRNSASATVSIIHLFAKLKNGVNF